MVRQMESLRVAVVRSQDRERLRKLRATIASRTRGWTQEGRPENKLQESFDGSSSRAQGENVSGWKRVEGLTNLPWLKQVPQRSE
jgi:hypothetical protein